MISDDEVLSIMQEFFTYDIVDPIFQETTHLVGIIMKYCESMNEILYKKNPQVKEFSKISKEVKF